MSTLDEINSQLSKVNQTAVAATVIVTALGGLITVIKNIIGKAEETGVDVEPFKVAIAAFDQAIATAETRDAEYQALRAQQEAAAAAASDPNA